MPQNIWTDWLQQDPSAQFQTALGNQASNWTPNMRQYWGGQYGNVYGRYMGALGQQVQSGQTPDLEFGDYLKKNPWMTQFQNLPRYQQGWNPRQFAPSMRYLLY